MMDANIRNLACAITMQAVRDYFTKRECKTKEKTEELFAKKRKAILKDLRSTWMKTITDGMSLIVAEQLELHPDEIAERLRRNCEDVL